MMDKLFFEVGREVCDNILEKVGLYNACGPINQEYWVGLISILFVACIIISIINAVLSSESDSKSFTSPILNIITSSLWKPYWFEAFLKRFGGSNIGSSDKTTVPQCVPKTFIILVVLSFYGYIIGSRWRNYSYYYYSFLVW